VAQLLAQRAATANLSECDLDALGRRGGRAGLGRRRARAATVTARRPGAGARSNPSPDSQVSRQALRAFLDHPRPPRYRVAPTAREG